MIPALQGGNMPWDNRKLIAFLCGIPFTSGKSVMLFIHLGHKKRHSIPDCERWHLVFYLPPFSSPSSFCRELWKGLEWGQRTTTCSAWVFWGLSSLSPQPGISHWVSCWTKGYSNVSAALECYHYPNTSAHGGFSLHIIVTGATAQTQCFASWSCQSCF